MKLKALAIVATILACAFLLPVLATVMLWFYAGGKFPVEPWAWLLMLAFAVVFILVSGGCWAELSEREEKEKAIAGFATVAAKLRPF